MNKKIKPEIVTPGVVGIGSLLMIMFIIGFFFRTWCGVQCIRTSYEITAALAEQQKLLDMQKNLNIEWFHLKSPEVLGKIAKEQFGLTVPSPNQIIIIP
jgi:cell division protein FtsL